MIFQNIALIGIGLIASSIARRIERDCLAGTVTGWDVNPDVRARAAELGYVQVPDSLEATVKNADLVVLAVPVGVIADVAAEIAPHLKKGAIVIDTGSVKGAIMPEIQNALPDHATVVPSHPLAGTEHSGPDSGFPTLFDNRWCILTPTSGETSAAVTAVTAFWESLGSKVNIMDPVHHDLVLAVTSHVPHLIAYTMVGVADDLQRVQNQEVIEYSATGFRDFTRIAASDPTMWRDVFLNNKDATLEILGRFTEELFDLQRAIRGGDGEQLFAYFERTREIRRGILEAGQDTNEPNFGRKS